MTTAGAPLSASRVSSVSNDFQLFVRTRTARAPACAAQSLHLLKGQELCMDDGTEANCISIVGSFSFQHKCEC